MIVIENKKLQCPGACAGTRNRTSRSPSDHEALAQGRDLGREGPDRSGQRVASAQGRWLALVRRCSREWLGSGGRGGRGPHVRCASWHSIMTSTPVAAEGSLPMKCPGGSAGVQCSSRSSYQSQATRTQSINRFPDDVPLRASMLS